MSAEWHWYEFVLLASVACLVWQLRRRTVGGGWHVVPIWFLAACIWLSRGIAATGSTVGLERIDIPGFDHHVRAVGRCLGIVPSTIPVDTYRATGLRWAVHAIVIRAHAAYPTKHDPHYRIVFVSKPDADLIRHEIIHTVLDRGGHPGWAFDNCVEADPAHYRVADALEEVP